MAKKHKHHDGHHSKMEYPAMHQATQMSYPTKYADKMGPREYAENKEHTGAMGPDSLGVASTAHIHHAPSRDYPLSTMSDGSMNYLQAQHGRYRDDGKKITRSKMKEYVE